MDKQEKTKIRGVVEAVDGLSLGISIVVAIIMGVGIGYLIRGMTDIGWTFFIGVFIGIAAAILNVYKAYAKQKEGYEELAKEPSYAIKKQLQDDDDDDDEDYGEKTY